VSLVPPTLAPSAATAVGFVTHLREHGDRIALIEGDRTLTYRELDAAVDAAASELVGNLAPARRLVLIALDRSLESVTTYLATLAAGHVALVAPETDVEARRDLVAAYDPDVIAHRIAGRWRVSQRRRGSVHDLHRELAVLLSTSGSTGSPKLVRLSTARCRRCHSATPTGSRCCTAT
jgi:acyl-CoA synthetase (AMP-forming)/AMP-acid ligase II